jgi:hypothetical protein
MPVRLRGMGIFKLKPFNDDKLEPETTTVLEERQIIHNRQVGPVGSGLKAQAPEVPENLVFQIQVVGWPHGELLNSLAHRMCGPPTIQR